MSLAYLHYPVLKMDFYFINFSGNCTGLCRSRSCPFASSAFSGNSLVIKPYLKRSRAVLKIICRASHASLRAIFVVVIRVQAVFCSVAGVAADMWQAAPRPPPTQLGTGTRRRCRGDRGWGIPCEAQDAPKGLSGAVPAGR